MAGAISIAAARRNAALDVILDATDAGAAAGTITVYSGVAPANADAALSGNTALATFTLADPAWSPAASGTKTLDADPDLTATAAATGTPTFARVFDSNGTIVFQGGCDETGTKAFTVSSASITSGASVTLLAGSITFPA